MSRLSSFNVASGTALVLASFVLALTGCGDPKPEAKSPPPKAAPQPVDFRSKVALESEPEYSGDARYGLLVKGFKADEVFWVAADDKHLFIDRNQDGSFSSDDEKLELASGAPVAIGKLGSFEFSFDASDNAEQGEALGDAHSVRLENGWKLCSLVRTDDNKRFPFWLAPKKEKAVSTHFDGEFKFGLKRPEIEFHPGEEMKFDVITGLEQLVDVKTGRTVYSSMLTEDLDASIHPTAEMKFPVDDPDKEFVVKTLTLKQRC